MPKTPVVEIRWIRIDRKNTCYNYINQCTPKVSLIHQDKISLTFLTTIGLKQGDVLSTILFNIYINGLPRRLLENSQSPDYKWHTTSRWHQNKQLTVCRWLSNFSLSKEDLQKGISILEEYRNKWGLDLNLSKTKIMISNKQGATIRKFKFKFQVQEIEIVKQYKYLGFTIIPSGKKH